MEVMVSDKAYKKSKGVDPATFAQAVKTVEKMLHERNPSLHIPKATKKSQVNIILNGLKLTVFYRIDDEILEITLIRKSRKMRSPPYRV